MYNSYNEIVEFSNELIKSALNLSLRIYDYPYTASSDMNAHLRRLVGWEANHPHAALTQLQNLPTDTILCVQNIFGYYTVLFHFPKELGDQVLMLGSFLTETATPEFLTDVMRRCAMPQDMRDHLRLHYSTFPVVQENIAIDCVRKVLEKCGLDIKDYKIVHNPDESEQQTVNIAPEFQVSYARDMVKRMEESRKALLHSLRLGNQDQSIRLLHDFMQYNWLNPTMSQTVDRNRLMIFIGFCEISLADCGIHPTYRLMVVNYLQKQVMECTNAERLNTMPEFIVRCFCATVRRRRGMHLSVVVQRAVNYIHLNLSEDLSLLALAQVVERSPEYLSGRFHKETGMTVTQYVQHYRLEEAAWLLKNSEYPIQDIALQVGISDSCYFAKLFRKKYGVTAQQFRMTEQ